MDTDCGSDTFKILLATDNHLGYGETNHSIENDTFDTFEEILQIANRENVDFILLGGDLFHETRPSTYCINKCIELIGKYCLGEKSVEIEILSDPSINFQRNATVNYEDPHINIAIPIFSIHGNHDDPTGKKHISALDLLASVRLINYFGRWDDVSNVEVHPVLLKKGESRLALYGLSHIRDERLARLFLENKVKMPTPENVNDWFNICILHQNRAKNRGVKNFIPETCIPKFIDLVMWGHEHDCQIKPVTILTGDIFITQPGSSVATSLAEGESIPKCVGILKVQHKQFSITPIELKTVRPFVFKQINLDPISNHDDNTSPSDITKSKLRIEIRNMIKEAKNLKRKENMLPLLRLIVYYHSEKQIFNAIRFGQEFAELVANPEDMLKFYPMFKKNRDRLRVDDIDDDIDEAIEIQSVEDLLKKNFTQDKLSVLNLAGLNESVRRFINCNDSDAPAFMILEQEQYVMKKLKELKPDENEIDEVLKRIQNNRNADEFQKILNNPNRPKSKTIDDCVIIDSDNEGCEANSSTCNEKLTKGSKGGKGSRGGRGKGRGKNK